jgi:ATP-dependent helicase/nuclease subunit B
MPSPVRFRRHFVPWDRPWLSQIAAWLGGDWEGAGPLDLSGVMALVPTRQSARRLREALAEHALSRGQAVFPPRAYTPDTLLALGSATAEVASRLEALLGWAEVLRTVDLAEIPDVLPVAPPRRDFPWAWRLGENLFRLQTQLNETGLAFRDVAPSAGADFPDAARWQQLAGLEQRQIAALAARGLREPHAVRREFARTSPVPSGVTRIVLLGSPDPLPLALSLLERWAESVPVDVVVCAPEAECDAFDDAGRPTPSSWAVRALELADFERRVHLCPDPAAQAEFAARIARGYDAPDGLVALATADAEVLPLLENELSRADIPSYNPEGRRRRDEALHTLLTALAAVGREPTFEAVAALGRCPDFLASLQQRWGDAFSAARFLGGLDQLRARHLPANLAALREVLNERDEDVRRGLDLVDEVQRSLLTASFPENAAAVLELLFANRRFDLSHPVEDRAAQAVEAWREVMQACAAARAAFPHLGSSEGWEVALRLYGEARSADQKAAGALELQGWLEVLWEDAPHLVIAGMNDGLVPDAIVGDAFLPESLRQTLGLKTNAARFARDAYLLNAIVQCRANAGRVDLLFAKNSAAGDPLRPSRLLLRCRDEELPKRVGFLFRPAESMQPNPAWTRAWRLSPRREPPPPRVPVTGLRNWLACPFRFYLRHVLRMEPVDPEKTELDARDFGTLCHAALEAMARDATMVECTDEPALREFLLHEFDLAAAARYGNELTLPVVVQLESARQRLSRVAEIQARERAAGWRIERVEWGFSLVASRLEVRGKIDRIDRHEASGAWRVLDYKTSDTATPPGKSHLRPFRAEDERLPAWMRVELNRRQFVWADLQLPVYLRALAQEPATGSMACGYISLPKAAGETALTLWPELSGELLAAAHACTDGVAAAIQAGEFWPPAEIPADRDAFATLFQHGAAESIKWGNAP